MQTRIEMRPNICDPSDLAFLADRSAELSMQVDDVSTHDTTADELPRTARAVRLQLIRVICTTQLPSDIPRLSAPHVKVGLHEKRRYPLQGWNTAMPKLASNTWNGFELL